MHARDRLKYTKMATVRSIVISEPLCFARGRLGKIREDLLKQILCDYFKVDQLALAKVRLSEDVEKLKLDRWPRPTTHRDGDGRAMKEVNDILLLLNFLDEGLILDSLPIYVCENPDQMPTTKWMDGDFQLLFAKLNKLEQDNNELKNKVNFLEEKLFSSLSQISTSTDNVSHQQQNFQAEIVKIQEFGESSRQACVSGFDKVEAMLGELHEKVVHVLDTNTCTLHTADAFSRDQQDTIDVASGVTDGNNTGSACAVSTNITTTAQPAQSAKYVHSAQFVQQPRLTWNDRVEAESRGKTQRTETQFRSGSITTAESDVDIDAEGSWVEVARRRARSNKRYRDDSGHAVQSDFTEQSNGQFGQPASFSSQSATLLRKQTTRSRVIGTGRNTLTKTTQIKSSGVVAEKSVFCVSNVSLDFNSDDVSAFLKDNDVTVLHCCPAKTKFEDSSAFRVCIPTKDKTKFLCPDIWPENVIIRDWFFKPKVNLSGNQRND